MNELLDIRKTGVNKTKTFLIETNDARNKFCTYQLTKKVKNKNCFFGKKAFGSLEKFERRAQHFCVRTEGKIFRTIY